MNVREAIEALREGGLVVLPTETVYGLAADAMNPSAVLKVFAAKGRPSDNPLIVHVADLESALAFAVPQDDRWLRLTAAFWPGPLTLVMPKRSEVPEVTTSGLDTVAVRCPDHPLALDVLKHFQGGLAAPSANPFMGVSPTRVSMLTPDILRAANVVLDGGPCRVGIESTVLDLSEPEAKILRPGDISANQIAAVLGETVGTGTARRSPGQYSRHYAPKTKLILVDALEGRPGLGFEDDGENQLIMPKDPSRYAAEMYAAFAEVDSWTLERVFIARPPSEPEWEAVYNRLHKAVSPE